MTHPPHAPIPPGKLPTTPAYEARRTVPAITVSSIADELHTEFPDDLTLLHATKLVQIALENRGYTYTEPDAAVWSSNREQILHAIRRHYTSPS